MGDADLSGSADVAWQRHVTTLVLQTIGSAGFALAGSGAIREHGITDRPTRDVDLFTTTATGPTAFAAAITDAEDALTRHGYRVTRTRTTPEFARIIVEAAGTRDDPVADASRTPVVEVDFGIDWRNEPPTQLAIGPVIALRDAVGSKIAAVYSRGEPATSSTSTRSAALAGSPMTTCSPWPDTTIPAWSSTASSTSSAGSPGSHRAAPSAMASTPMSSTPSRRA